MSYQRDRADSPPEPGEVRRTEIVVEVEDRPGMLASIGEVLGGADVNIIAAAVFTQSGRGIIHLVVDDSSSALRALGDARVDVKDVQDVYSVTLEDRPGELGRYARSLSDHGVNISTLYVAGERGGEKELIVSVENSKEPRR